MIDAYRTIAEPTRARIKRKRSRFLAFLYPAVSAEEAAQRLAELRRSYHDASHHCSATRLLVDDEIDAACDDDGEPSGSAGPPILHHLEAADIVNVIAVVVRYYGGVNLGVGGLIRAYGDATQEALDAASVVKRHITSDIAIRFPPDVNSGVMATIHRHAASVKDIRFEETAEAVVSLPPSRVAAFCAAVREATGNRASTEVKP